MRNSIKQSAARLTALLLSCFLASLAAQQGAGPSVQLSAPTLSFGNQIVGSSGVPLTETVTAQVVGTQAVIFGSISLSGNNAADFTAQSDTCSGTNRYSGEICQITVVFHPSGLGIRSAAIGINDNAGGSPQTFTLQGTGTELKLISVMVDPPDPNVVSGSRLQLTAQGTYNDGSQKDVTSAATWTSSDNKVATVRQGLASAFRAGKTNITAELGDVKGRVLLSVEYQVLFSIQPGTTPVSKAISPGVRVQVRDNGSPVENVPVTIDLGPNPPNPAELSGGHTRTTGEDGAVTFEDLKLDYFGNGYTLVVSASGPGGRSSATSAPFNETRVGDPCLGPNPACSSGCADTDGDGLNDAWEKAGGIDINGDGRIDERYDLMLPRADPGKPDIYVWYDYMDYGLPGNSCTQNSQCGALGGGHLGETCIAPSANGLTCAMACTTDSQCTSRIPSGAHTGERCIANMCQHTHDPLALDASGLQPVVDRFAAHGINLHLLRGHAQPHSHVISYRKLSDFDNFCEGASLSSGTAGLGKYAESLYDIKPRSTPDRSNIAYHYAFFGHYVGCDTAENCTTPFLGGTSDCPYATNPDGTPKNIPTQGGSGLAEFAGNDLVVSLGGLINDAGFLPHFVQQAAFMHELGHNLGMHHDGHIDNQCKDQAGCRPGDYCTDILDGQGLVCHEITGGFAGVEQPNYKPNYLSIMNYRYEFSGIPVANAIGSSTLLTCTVDSQCGGDGGMCVGGHCFRLDYSRQTLPTGGNTPGALVENNLNGLAGLGSGTADLFFYRNGMCTPQVITAPTTGPVDWNGDRNFTAISATADVDAITTTCAGSPADKLSGFTDWPDLSGIPFQYNFQCRSPGGPKGDGVSPVQLRMTAPAVRAKGEGR
jgi:hypothetical protein